MSFFNLLINLNEMTKVDDEVLGKIASNQYLILFRGKKADQNN